MDLPIWAATIVSMATIESLPVRQMASSSGLNPSSSSRH